MIQLLLGIIIGMLAMFAIFVFSQRQSTTHILTKILNNPIINPKDMAFIAGLSDEEQSFADSLNSDNKDTKLS